MTAIDPKTQWRRLILAARPRRWQLDFELVVVQPHSSESRKVTPQVLFTGKELHNNIDREDLTGLHIEVRIGGRLQKTFTHVKAARIMQAGEIETCHQQEAVCVTLFNKTDDPVTWLSRFDGEAIL